MDSGLPEDKNPSWLSSRQAFHNQQNKKNGTASQQIFVGMGAIFCYFVFV
ncbi:MAG: hypothetical protein H7838_02290 [Magnetococcus sp. DMHC-8]